MSLGIVSVPAEPALEVLRGWVSCRSRGVGGWDVQLLAWSVMLPVGLRGW